MTPGRYEVRLYFAELFFTTAGARVFNVAIEGNQVLSQYDIVADVGAFTGVMKSFTVTADASLDILFSHVVENPKINAIEILDAPAQPGELGVAPPAVSFPSTPVGQTSVQSLQVTNLGESGDPNIVVSGTTISGTHANQFADNFNDATDVTLAPGQSTTITVTFAPTCHRREDRLARNQRTLAPTIQSLFRSSGTAGSTTPIGFGKSTLAGATGLSSPTSLDFGPDGRLYVAEQSGLIRVYTVTRHAANNYAVTLATDDHLDSVRSEPQRQRPGELDHHDPVDHRNSGGGLRGEPGALCRPQRSAHRRGKFRHRI